MSVAKALRPFSDLNAPWVLLASPAFHETAEKLVAAMPKHTVEYVQISWSHFPDRTPRIMLDASIVQGRDVILLAEINMEDMLSYFSVVYAVPRYFARTFLVVTPFFPTGTMERVEFEGEIATAMTLARMMNATPSATVGETCFMMFDIHALATRFFFADSIKPWLATAVPMLLQRLQDEFSEDKNPSKRPIAIAFPDDGAKKRFGSLFGGGNVLDFIVCSKTRVGDARKLVVQEGDIEGRDVLIVDDMVQSGGTMLECVKLMQCRGATSVSCYVTHGVFPNDSWIKFATAELVKIGHQPLRRFLLTDSIPSTAKKVRGVEPFVVLSIADRLAEMLTEVPPGTPAASSI